MQREIGRGRRLANAALVAGILAVSVFGMAQVASRHWLVQQTFHVRRGPQDNRRPRCGQPGARARDGRRRGRTDRAALAARRARHPGSAARRAAPSPGSFRRDRAGGHRGGRGVEGRRDRPRPSRRPAPGRWRINRAAPIEPATCSRLRELAPADRRRRRGRREGPGRDPADRRHDPQAGREASASLSRTTRRIASSSPLGTGRANPRRPGGQPRRAEADLAALALLQRPIVLRPRNRVLFHPGAERESQTPPRRMLCSSPADRC